MSILINRLLISVMSCEGEAEFISHSKHHDVHLKCELKRGATRNDALLSCAHHTRWLCHFSSQLQKQRVKRKILHYF